MANHHTFGESAIKRRGEREHEQGHTGDEPAAAAVGPDRDRQAPADLCNGRDEGHRAERGVLDVERVLEVRAEQADARPEHVGHERGGGQHDQRREAVRPEDAEQWRRFALAGARDELQIRDCVDVPVLARPPPSAARPEP